MAGQDQLKPVAVFRPDSIVQLDTLKNGLRFIGIQNPDLERVYWSIQFAAPRQLEHDRSGLAALTGELLRYGTDSLDTQALDELLERYDAEIRTSAGHLTASSPKEHAFETLALLANILVNPSFESGAFAEVIERNRRRIENDTHDVHIRSQELAHQQVFTKKHPYGEGMTPVTLDSISQEEIRGHHAAWYRPQYAAVAVEGPLSNEKTRGWMQSTLGEWLPREIPPIRHNLPVKPIRNRVCMVDMTDEQQMAVTLAHTVRLKPGHKDEAACLILNALLSYPALPGRIVDKSCNSPECFAQTASALRADPITAHFQLSRRAEPSRIVEFIELSLKSMHEFTRERVDESMVQQAVNLIIGDITTELGDPQKNLDAWLYALLRRNHALGPTALISALQAVTASDVQRVAIQYLRPNNLIIALAGDRDLLPTGIEQFSGEDGIEYYDPWGNPLLELDPAPAGVTAATVFQDYYRVCGGVDQFEKLQSLVRKGQMNAGTGMELNVEIATQYGRGHAMQVAMNGQLMMEQLITDKGGVNRQMGQSTTMSDSEYQRLRPNLYAARYLHLKELELSAELLGLDRDIDGPHYVVEIQFNGTRQETLYFHEKSHLLIRSAGERQGPTGPVKVTTSFSDYRVAKNITLPMTIVQTTNGQSMTFGLNEAIPNGRISDSLFEMN